MIQENQETAVDHGAASSSSSSRMNNIGYPMMMPVYYASSEMSTMASTSGAMLQHMRASLPREFFIKENQETTVDHGVTPSSLSRMNIGNPMMPVYHNEYQQRINGMDHNRFITTNSEMSTMPSTSGAMLQQHVDAANYREQAVNINQPKSSSSGKIRHWTVQEHMLFLIGIEYFGWKNKWGRISRDIFHGAKLPMQISSHAQKYFDRQRESCSESILQGGSSSGQGADRDGVGSCGKKKKKSDRIHDINWVPDPELKRFIDNGLISVAIGAEVLKQRHRNSSSMPALPSSSPEQPMIPSNDETNVFISIDDHGNLMFD